ncbi:hypothetical protein ACFW1A_14405 [Kitasatospora sp. NPDC058965]|uniref:hypothetical protein n=1 Tax=Kitasatospora sp. NPDC058965 TaxID=3346682 RepID=UPI00368A51E2
MDKEAREAWWARLPAGIREQIDGWVLRDASMAAIRLVVEIGLVPDDIGVGTAQLIVGDRYEHHGDRIALEPLSPLDLDSLAVRAAGRAEPILAIEAVWDGDTVHDWFVLLMAVTEDPKQTRSLATVYRSTAKKYLGEAEAAVHRHPHAVAARRAGQALADHLGVPFHFASPDTPDDEAPRWRPER